MPTDRLARLRAKWMEWLESEDFDRVAYAYRSAPPTDQDAVWARFDDLTKAIADHAAELESVLALPPQEHEELTTDVLDAPCRWCGYNGHGYWQEKRHSPWCPFRLIAGRSAREKLLKEFPREMRESMAAPTPADGAPQEQEPTE